MPLVSCKAVAGFVLGLLAVPLNLFAALPALVIGLMGLREINRSDGRMSGRWMSIIGIMLGGLIIVADALGVLAWGVYRLRQNSYRVECTNNLRQIGLAVNMYLTDHKVFPLGTIRNAALSPDQRLSWVASLLPYYIDMEAERRKTNREATPFFSVNAGIDRDQAWDALANREATARYLRVFVCPAHPFFDEEPSPGPTYYVGIAGIGTSAAEFPLSDSNRGIFGYDRVITPNDVKFGFLGFAFTKPNDVPRGLSYTMMVCETAGQPGPWAQGGFATVRGLDPNDLPYTGPSRSFGGLHPDITNLLMADGSVQVFRDSGAASEFAAKATLKPEAAHMPDH